MAARMLKTCERCEKEFSTGVGLKLCPACVKAWRKEAYANGYLQNVPLPTVNKNRRAAEHDNGGSWDNVVRAHDEGGQS